MAINPLSGLKMGAGLLLPGPLRLVMARRAARRQSAAALRLAPNDPVTLAALGLHEAALAAVPRDDGGRAAQAIARAGIGDVNGALAAAASLSLDVRETLRLVLAGAPFAPGRMLSLAAADRPLLRAALALAAGDLDEARRMVEVSPAGRERAALTAGIAGTARRWRDARDAIADLFASDGLTSPLERSSGAISLAALAGEAGPTPPARGPLVSVIVPVRNAEETLSIAVGSLLAQSWRDLEVLLIDDASADGSAALAERLAAGDPRVRRLHNHGDRGAAGARNAGIAAARGEYLLFHDADDWAHPSRISRQFAAVGRGIASVSAHVRMDRRGALCAPLVSPFVRYAPISLMVRASAARRAGPIETSRVGSDSEYLARLDLVFGRAAVTRDPAVLTIFDWNSASLSGDPHLGIGSIEGMAERRRYRHEWLLRHARAGLPFGRFWLSQAPQGKAAPS